MNVTAGLGGKSYLSYLKVPDEYVVDKDEFTTETIVKHFGFTATTAKRYLRQLTEFGYLESHGGNRNRSFRIKDLRCK